MGAKGIKRSGILRWFQKCVELLRQEVFKDFFSEKHFLAKFSKSLKNHKKFPFYQTRDFCTFLKSVQDSASFDNLYAQCWRNFFSTFIRGSATFFEDKRSNKIETVQYFNAFYKLVKGFQGQTKNTCWIYKKMSKSLDPTAEIFMYFSTVLKGFQQF